MRNEKGQFLTGSEEAREAGSKGGKMSWGNFKYDRERAARAGRKGGLNGKGKKKVRNV